MVHDSMKALQYDRRLRKRRGWVSEEDFEGFLEGLPDVADKGEVISADVPAEAPAAASSAAAAPSPPAPPAGEPAAPPSFGGPDESDPTLG